MLFGPVFHSELLMTARRRRYYVARFAYGLFLLYALRQQYVEWTDSNYYIHLGNGSRFDPTTSIKAMALFASVAFVGFAWAQGVAILWLLPAFLGGVIADEHQRKTLHYLLGSRLSSLEIVMGKLGARLLHVGVMLFMGVPIVCLVALFGGLDPWEVALVYAGTVSMTLFVAGLSMLVSVIANRPRTGIIASYLLLAAWLYLPPLIGAISTHIEPTGLGWLIPIGKFFMLMNPNHCWELVSQLDAMNQYNAAIATAGIRGFSGAVNAVTWQFRLMVGLQTAFGLLFLILAVVLLRPIRGGGGTWERRRTVWFPNLRTLRIFPRPACGDNAMLWKERHSASGCGLGWLASLPVVLIAGLVMGAYLIEAAPPAFREFAGALSGEPGVIDRHRLWLNDTIRQCNLCLFMLLLISVPSAAAASITSEREQDTWISLIATLLTGREIVSSKIRGAIWSIRRIVWLMVGLWALGMASGAVHPLGALLAALELAAAAWFAAALGVYISLRAKNSTRALVATMVILLLLNGGYLLLVIPWLNSHPLLWSGSTPFIETAALLSYREIDTLRGAATVVGSYFSPSVRDGSAIIVSCAVSILLYSAGAVLLSRLSLGVYDRVVDRPRRSPTTRPLVPRPHGDHATGHRVAGPAGR